MEAFGLVVLPKSGHMHTRLACTYTCPLSRKKKKSEVSNYLSRCLCSPLAVHPALPSGLALSIRHHFPLIELSKLSAHTVCCPSLGHPSKLTKQGLTFRLHGFGQAVTAGFFLPRVAVKVVWTSCVVHTPFACTLGMPVLFLDRRLTDPP